MFPKLGLCKAGKTLPVEGVLEMLKAQNEVEDFRFSVFQSSGEDWVAAIGRSLEICRRIWSRGSEDLHLAQRDSSDDGYATGHDSHGDLHDGGLETRSYGISK